MLLHRRTQPLHPVLASRREWNPSVNSHAQDWNPRRTDNPRETSLSLLTHLSFSSTSTPKGDASETSSSLPVPFQRTLVAFQDPRGPRVGRDPPWIHPQLRQKFTRSTVLPHSAYLLCSGLFLFLDQVTGRHPFPPDLLKVRKDGTTNRTSTDIRHQRQALNSTEPKPPRASTRNNR